MLTLEELQEIIRKYNGKALSIGFIVGNDWKGDDFPTLDGISEEVEKVKELIRELNSYKFHLVKTYQDQVTEKLQELDNKI
jgi:hypothetical protein